MAGNGWYGGAAGARSLKRKAIRSRGWRPFGITITVTLYEFGIPK